MFGLGYRPEEYQHFGLDLKACGRIADEAIAYVRGGGMFTLAPLRGGIPPDIAWKYLRCVDEAVIPALTAESPVPS